ncbi:MAG TPA: sulfatase-like hydrolase/transferase [Bacteroidia bacterium]|jgi:phosphoglycerol transferase MdoB-like AlkP superfamily enzyme|nr:sulfatase-like hydrolase/transferase [Bacteroidia bacterium]
MNYKARLAFLVWIYVLALFVFTDARIIFYLYHHNRFEGGFWTCLFYGLRFDMVAVTTLNGLFIFLVAFPFSLLHSKIFRVFLKITFMLVNGMALLVNFVDIAYFPFTLRRSTPDTISFFIEKNEAGTLLPVFLADFWHLVLLFIVYLFLMSWLYNVIQRKFLSPYVKEAGSLKQLAAKSFYFLLIAGLSVLGIRGGTQLIPLSIIDAENSVNSRYVPLVLNTPFCFIKSGVLYTLEEKDYMSDAEAQKIYNPEKKYNYAAADFQNKNVVVIIVESLSKEYTGLGKRKSYTPFLDSLMQNSLVFTNAFSNGKRSIEGIPAILASMPSFQYDYISTVYSNNKITSLANVLKTKGYYSSFFHGGTNGTMNFNGFCAGAGFDKYFGRSEYNNEKDYDGDWGIWDEPFLQGMASELDKQKQPFVSAVFTLNSHYPYRIPEKYKAKFPEGKLPIYKCISYADYCLQKFFATAKKQKWFANTLFVLMADHTGVSEDWYYDNSCGNYQIPLFFYLPDNSLKGSDPHVAQQIDVLPTTLYLLKYDQSFFAFGNNLLDSTQTKNRFAVNYYNVCYQYFTDSKLLQYNGTNAIGYYQYRTDSLLNNSLAPDAEMTETEKRAKAFIQQYNNRVIHNKTSVR